MSDFSKAQIGDRLFDVRYGWGTVIIPATTKLKVKFDATEKSECYECSGKPFRDYQYPTLFWDEVKIEAPPRPKRKVKKEGWIALHQLNSGTIIGGSVYEDKESIPTEPKPLAINRVTWEEWE